MRMEPQLSRSIKVLVIAALALLSIFHLTARPPSLLTSWNPNIDLLRYTIHTTGTLEPTFYSERLANQFSTSEISQDSVHSLVLGTLTIVGGASGMSEQLSLLYWIPAPLIVSTAIVLFFLREVHRNAPRMSTSQLSSIGILILLPASRVQSLFRGWGSSFFASSLILLFLTYVLMSVRMGLNGRRVLVLVVTIFVIMNIRHTWTAYFLILVVTMLLFYSVDRFLLSRNQSAGRPQPAVIGALLLVPTYWFTLGLFQGANLIESRIRQFIGSLSQVTRGVPPRTTSLYPGFYDPDAAGPLAPYQHRPPPLTDLQSLFAINTRLISIVEAALILIATIGLLVIWLRKSRAVPYSKFGLILSGGSVAVFVALYLFGGIDAFLARGFQILTLTGPIIISMFLIAKLNPKIKGNYGSRHYRQGSIPPRSQPDTMAVRVFSVPLILVAISALIMTPTVSQAAVSGLGPKEATGVTTLASLTDNDDIIFSDFRTATAFLYTQPQNFDWIRLRIPADVATTTEEIEGLYTGDCDALITYLGKENVRSIYITEQVREVAIRTPSAVFVPPPNLFECSHRFHAKPYSNGGAAWTV